MTDQSSPTSHSQAGTLKEEKADGDVAEPSGSCSLWHDESGSRPVPLPGTHTHTATHFHYRNPTENVLVTKAKGQEY